MLRAKGYLPIKAGTLKELLVPDFEFRNVAPERSFLG